MKGMMPDANPKALEMGFVSQTVLPGLAEKLEELRQECEGSELLSASDHIEDMLARMRAPIGAVSVADYFRFDAELNKRIEHDLKRKVFYQLRPDAAKLFENEDPFGQQVSLRFPCSIHDIREACRCFACARYDATVYHSARTLEAALRQFAEMLGIEYSVNWGAYIEAIRKRIEGTNPKDAADRARRDFISSAATKLQTVQLSWRNESMHVGSQYGADQAKDILDSARAFMQDFSDGLSKLEDKHAAF